MNLKIPVLLLILLFTCQNKHDKIVWIHFNEDLNMLHGDVKQVTTTFDDPLAKNFYCVFDIGEDGKERELQEHFNSIDLKIGFVAKYNNVTGGEYFIGYVKHTSATGKDQVSVNNTKVGTYEYDKQGRIIKYVKIGGAEEGKICNYKYNNSGDLIECDEYHDNKLDAKTIFKYDKRHLIIESLMTEFEINSSTEKISYQYKNFDSMNNWLTKIIKPEDGKSKTETRKIIYY